MVFFQCHAIFTTHCCLKAGSTSETLAQPLVKKNISSCDCCTCYQILRRWPSVGWTMTLFFVSHVHTTNTPIYTSFPFAYHFGDDARVLPCKAKRQYLLTLPVSGYCLLALQSSVAGVFRPGQQQAGTMHDRLEITASPLGVLYAGYEPQDTRKITTKHL